MKKLKKTSSKYIGVDSRTWYYTTESALNRRFQDGKNESVADSDINLNSSNDLITIKKFEMYTQPTLKTHNPNDWYVEFYYQFPSQPTQRVRIRAGLNRKIYAAEKETAAEQLLKTIKQMLYQGQFIGSKKIPKTDLIEDCLKIAFEKICNLKSLETKIFYKTCYNRFILFASEKSLEKISEVTNDVAQQFRTSLKTSRNLKNTTINGTIRGLKAMFELLGLEKNPFTFKSLPKNRSSIYIPFTKEEKFIVSKSLKANNPELYLFANLIYTCFLRPIEICSLQVKDFIKSNDGFFIMLKSENSKVNHTSYRQVTPALEQLIMEYQILSMPKNKLVFEKLTGVFGTGRQMRRKVTELWKKEVKQKLGIDKEMYGLKHTGNIDYIRSHANMNEVNLIWLQRQNDHTSLAMTQNYIKDLGIYKLSNNELMNFNLF